MRLSTQKTCRDSARNPSPQVDSSSYTRGRDQHAMPRYPSVPKLATHAAPSPRSQFLARDEIKDLQSSPAVGDHCPAPSSTGSSYIQTEVRTVAVGVSEAKAKGWRHHVLLGNPMVPSHPIGHT